MPEFNEWQRLVADTYGGGDHAHVNTIAECAGVGDTLFLFLMRELATSEGCENGDEAARRVSAAIDDLKEIIFRIGRPVPYTGKLYDASQVHTAMCLIEEIVDPAYVDAAQPWEEYRDQVGIDQLRDDVAGLIEPVDAAWSKAYAAYEASKDPQAPEPGPFDYEFVPFWLREAVEWDRHNGPRVRGAKFDG